MRRIVYSPRADRLVYLSERATPEFWDARWQAAGAPSPSRKHREIVRVTARYLAGGSRILEGGCGRSDKVKALADAGFAVTGVDFAPESVRRARLTYPGLEIREGDVRSLPFQAGIFDGYWSLGVIEHFWDGYDAILAEARRVLRPEGFLFLTAPWFSPYRRLKAGWGDYPHQDFDSEPQGFYQYALASREIVTSLDRHGFDVRRLSGISPETSMLEDMTGIQRPVRWLLGSRGSPPKRVLRRIVTGSVGGFCGHSFMAIARRRRGDPDPG